LQASKLGRRISMADPKTLAQLDKELLDDVLGDASKALGNPDPLHVVVGDIPPWMTENILDPKPAPKQLPKEA
jgi:hypothetical protein